MCNVLNGDRFPPPSPPFLQHIGAFPFPLSLSLFWGFHLETFLPVSGPVSERMENPGLGSAVSGSFGNSQTFIKGFVMDTSKGPTDKKLPQPP